MSSGPHTRFYLDKKNAKWAGLCAGIADYTGIDVNVVRAGFVFGTFMSGGSLFFAYFVIAWMSPRKPTSLYHEDKDRKKFWQDVRRSPRFTVRDVRSRLRQVDRRLADVEGYITSSHGRLAREIEQLR